MLLLFEKWGLIVVCNIGKNAFLIEERLLCSLIILNCSAYWEIGCFISRAVGRYFSANIFELLPNVSTKFALYALHITHALLATHALHTTHALHASHGLHTIHALHATHALHTTYYPATYHFSCLLLGLRYGKTHNVAQLSEILAQLRLAMSLLLMYFTEILIWLY